MFYRLDNKTLGRTKHVEHERFDGSDTGLGAARIH